MRDTNKNAQLIRDAIRQIALRGVVNSETGAVVGTGKVTGYVAKIHDNEDDELFGTVDVQEYVDVVSAQTGELPEGYHQGVLLTAIQDSWNGMVVIPRLYSDVVVTRDADTGYEYVTMYSHVQTVRVRAWDEVEIGVVGREEYDPDDPDSPDIQELEETGARATTQINLEGITSTVSGEDGSDSSVVTQLRDSVTSDVGQGGTIIKQDTGSVTIDIGGGGTTLTMDGDGIEGEHGSGRLKVDGSESTLEQGSSKVKVTSGVVYVGNDSGTDVAVLGRALADVLSELMSYLTHMLTPTLMGPQPPASIMAQLISLQAKIRAYSASVSGFLTQKVQIQK